MVKSVRPFVCSRAGTLLCCVSLILLGMAFPSDAHAQIGSVEMQRLNSLDLTTIDVDELSDEQIELVLMRAEAAGLTLDDMEEMARARGASPSQIAAFRRRAREVRSGERRADGSPARSEPRTSEPSPADLLRQIRARAAADTTTPAPPEPAEPKKIIFGADLFSNPDLTFTPSLNLPTPQNYQLAPGDELIVSIWGAAENTYRLPVERDGTVRIENLGPIYVNGLTIEEAEARLLGRLRQLYAGLNESESSRLGTFADVTLGRMRTITVHIMGEVKVPGSYPLPSLATVLNALYVCAGPNERGTYRRIQVIRGDRLAAEFDVYDFLVNGSQRGNIRLMDQDILKVDPYLARVEVEGEVKRPALFEVRERETLSDVLRFAGSFTEEAYTRRVKLHRNTDTERRLLDVTKEEFAGLPMRNGDRVFVGRLLDRFENRVEIQGAVYREGEYELGEATSVYDLIQRAEGLKGDAFLSRAHVIRTRPDLTTELIPFDLGRLMRDPGAYNLALQKDDVVVIPSLSELKEEYEVEIVGSVQEPGTYPYMENMTLQDLIVLAGGLRDEASLLRVEVARRRMQQQSEGQPNQIADIDWVTIDEALSIEEGEAQFRLQPFDQVFVRKSPSYIAQRNVVITGEVMYPGRYTIGSKEDRVSDLIARAGGLTDGAYPRGARLIRTFNDIGPVGIDLERILQQPRSPQDLLVEAGDSLHIPLRLETVKVSGAVYAPANIRYTRRLDLRDYVNRAGGPMDRADLSRAYVVYANGSIDRVRKQFLFRHSPRIEPGAEIVVPLKPEKEGLSAGERITILSTVVSVTAIVSTTIFQIIQATR